MVNGSFFDHSDTMVFTSKSVIDDGDWVHYVSHDEEDGAWQFHGIHGAPESESEARLVLFRNMLQSDSSLSAILDLPVGWFAWRDAADGPWKRGKQE